MKINADSDGTIRLKDVFNSVVFETDEGEELVVCMRDGAFEIAVKDIGAKGENEGDKSYTWYTANSGGISRSIMSIKDIKVGMTE
jgi:hypothetical protein